MKFSTCRPLGLFIGTIGLVTSLSGCYSWRRLAPEKVVPPNPSPIRVSVRRGPPIVLYDAVATSDSLIGFRRSDHERHPEYGPQRMAVGVEQIEKVERHALDGYKTGFTVVGVAAAGAAITALVVAATLDFHALGGGWE